MTTLSIVPVSAADSEHVNSVRVNDGQRVVDIGVLSCSTARELIEAFIDHAQSGERRIVLASDGKTLFEIRLTRLRSNLRRIRVSKQDELGDVRVTSGKVVMKADVEPEALYEAATTGLDQYRAIVGDSNCG